MLSPAGELEKGLEGDMAGNLERESDRQDAGQVRRLARRNVVSKGFRRLRGLRVLASGLARCRLQPQYQSQRSNLRIFVHQLRASSGDQGAHRFEYGNRSLQVITQMRQF